MVTTPALKLDLAELDNIKIIEESTGVYDTGFFNIKSTSEHLSDARIGLDLFLNEANQALQRSDLTNDQRIHIARIVTFVQSLTDRFDTVSSPEFAARTK